MGQVICAECGAVDEYELRDSTREYEGDGYHFTLPVKVPFCTRCGAPVAMEEIEEPISREANRRIRECKGIIQTEEIQQILHDYQVTPEALSRLLGWDEAAVARYVEKGYTPSVENSNTLKALKDPKVFRALARASQSDTEKRYSFEKNNRKRWQQTKLERWHGYGLQPPDKEVNRPDG